MDIGWEAFMAPHYLSKTLVTSCHQRIGNPRFGRIRHGRQGGLDRLDKKPEPA